MVRIWMGVFLAAACLSCGQTSQESADPDGATSVWMENDFRVPSEIQAIAPRMQDHLLQLLRFDGPLFRVKPVFVFLDGEKETQGPPNVLVTALTFVHLAYYHGAKLVWSGSILFDPERGVGLNSLGGYSIDVIPQGTAFEVAFRDGEHALAGRVSAAKSQAVWFEKNDRRLYVNHRLLPRAIRKP